MQFNQTNNFQLPNDQLLALMASQIYAGMQANVHFNKDYEDQARRRAVGDAGDIIRLAREVAKEIPK